jgi:hypothetical protein
VEGHQQREDDMESSFKKSYQKTMNPDGSFELAFKSKRLNPRTAAGVGMLIVFAMLPASCAVTLPVAMLFGTGRDFMSVPVWIALTLITFGIGCYMIANTSSKVVVVPNKGLVFKGKNLPFSDIQNIGTIHTPALGNSKGSAYVYAESFGTQVNISKYITLSLADSLVAEIKESSGVVWK